jgi:hypothetical protein
MSPRITAFKPVSDGPQSDLRPSFIGQYKGVQLVTFADIHDIRFTAPG